jgi:hypothetical protein
MMSSEQIAHHIDKIENEPYKCLVRDNTGSLSFVSNPVISGLFEA